MLRIIGHRGAAGIALENSRAALEMGVRLGLRAMEIDVRLTKDRELVLSHDHDLERTAGQNIHIRDHTLAQLKEIRMNDGSQILTLDEALKIARDTMVIIEIKDHDAIRPLLKVIDEHPKANIRIASFKLKEVGLLEELRPSLMVYGLEGTKPFEAIYLARILNLDGIGFNYWLLNPLTYFLARRSKLELYAYTVNSRFMVRFLHALYPKVWICTNHPEWFVRKRRLSLRRRRASNS